MKLLPSFKNLFGLNKKTGTTGVTINEWLRGDDIDLPRSRFVLPYQQSAWIYVAVTVLAETVGHIPFRISRSRPKGEELVESGPLVDLFNNPAPSLTRTLFWQTLVSWEALRGEFFVVPLDENGSVSRLGRGVQPKRLITLNPDHMRHIVRGNELIGWRYSAQENTSNMAQQLLLPEEVIHSRRFNPYLYWRGLSPLSVALVAAETDFAAAQFMKALMENNGDGGLIAICPHELPGDQKEQITAALRERRRLGTAAKPLVLDANLTVQQPMISSADMQFLENRKLNREEIGAIYKVPESMMGFGDEKSGLSAGTAIQQDRLNFIQNTIAGLCGRLEAALEPIVKSFGADLHGWFDLDSLPIMQSAREGRLASAMRAFNLGVPFNEINEAFGLGFRPLPWGSKGYMNKNLVELGELANVSRSVGESVSRRTADPELAIARMLELVPQTSPACGTVSLREADVRLSKPATVRQLPPPADLEIGDTAGLETCGTSTPSKSNQSKLRRFIFEQRNRALEKLEQEFGFLHVRFQQGLPFEPVLDSKHENALFFAKMGNIDGSHIEQNEERVKEANEAVQKGLDADEDFAEIANRVKRVFA